MSAVKIFQINECDWYAGETAEDCVRCYLGDHGEQALLDEFGSPHELSEIELDTLTLRDIDGQNGGGDQPFRQWLSWIKERGLKFPRLFASTEY